MSTPGANNSVTSFSTTPSISSDAVHVAKVGLFAGVIILVMLFVITGNVIVLLVLHRQRKQAAVKVANMFLANLAVVDLAVGFLLFPFAIVTTISREWILGQAMCEVNGFLNMTAGTASILTMAVISVDRYRAIVCAPGHKFEVKQAWVLLFAVWFWSILIGILPILGWNEYHHGEFSSLCKISTDKDSAYVVLTVVTCFAIPLAIMFYCYLRVFLKVRHHRKQLQSWQSREVRTNIKSEAKTAKIVFTVLFAFVIMWAPFVLVTIIQANVSSIPPEVFIFFNLTAGAHSACNPVIYVTMNRKFRGDMLQMVPCFAWVAGCCCTACGRSAANQVEPTRTDCGGKAPIDRIEIVSA